MLIGEVRQAAARFHALFQFAHDIDDLAILRMFTSRLYINGSASQTEICRAFGVSKICVRRSAKLYREKGMAVFLAPRVCRGPAVLTTEVLAQVQHLLDEEHSVQDIAKELDLKADALHKALRLDKLRRPLKKEVRLQLVNGNRSPIGLRIGYITKSLEVERSEGVALWPYAD